MRKIPVGIMVVVLLAICISSCRSVPAYRWQAEPEIKGAVPLSPNTPIYFYFGSKIAGIKCDKEKYKHENRRYVLSTVVRDGEIRMSWPFNHYRELEYSICIRDRSHSCYSDWNMSQKQLDTLIGDEYEFWEKYIPDKKYLWIKPEGGNGETMNPGHSLIGKGKLIWYSCSTLQSNGYSSDYNLEKADYIKFASYALARGENIVIIEDEYDLTGEWDNLLLMRFEELLAGKL